MAASCVVAVVAVEAIIGLIEQVSALDIVSILHLKKSRTKPELLKKLVALVTG